MIDAYKRFPLKYQIAAIVGLTIVAFVISLIEGQQPFLIAGLVAGVLVVLHLFLSKLNSLLAFIVITIQIFMFVALIYGLYIYGTPIADLLTIDINLAVLMLGSFGIAMLASYIYVGYKFSRGRLWFNLALGFFIASVITFVILMINPLFYVAAMAAGYIVGLAYLILRTPNPKKRPQVQKTSLSNNTARKAEELFTEQQLQFIRLKTSGELSGAHYLVHNSHVALLVTVAEPSKTFSVTNSGIMCDSFNLVPVLEQNQEQLNRVRRKAKIVPITQALLVLSSAKQLQPVMSVNLSSWKQPDYVLGVTQILTTAGFSRFIKATSGELKPFTTKQAERFSQFFAKLN
jgi:hypothetical protein